MGSQELERPSVITFYNDPKFRIVSGALIPRYSSTGVCYFKSNVELYHYVMDTYPDEFMNELRVTGQIQYLATIFPDSLAADKIRAWRVKIKFEKALNDNH